MLIENLKSQFPKKTTTNIFFIDSAWVFNILLLDNGPIFPVE